MPSTSDIFPAEHTAEQVLEFERCQVEQAKALQAITESKSEVTQSRCSAFEKLCEETKNISFTALVVCIPLFFFYEVAKYNSDPAVLAASAANQRVQDNNNRLEAELRDAHTAYVVLLKQITSDKATVPVEK